MHRPGGERPFRGTRSRQRPLRGSYLVRTIVGRFFWIKFRVAGQGMTKEIFAKGASLLYSTHMHEQDASVYAHESADEIKLLRRNAKRRLAFLIKKIKLICEETGSRSELRVNRQFLVASQEGIS